MTDPGAAVAMLEPDHPPLTAPDRITAEDWADWDKQRGLYFAADWAPCYAPLLAISVAGVAPLLGRLDSGRNGKGRHTHTGSSCITSLTGWCPGPSACSPTSSSPPAPEVSHNPGTSAAVAWLLTDLTLVTGMTLRVKRMGADDPALQLVFLRSLLALALIAPLPWRTRAALVSMKAPRR